MGAQRKKITFAFAAVTFYKQATTKHLNDRTFQIVTFMLLVDDNYCVTQRNVALFYDNKFPNTPTECDTDLDSRREMTFLSQF